MASGRLGAISPSASTYTTAYTVPASTLTVCSISICNQNTSSVTVRLSISTSTSPATADFIEYDLVLLPNTTIERTGLVLNNGYLLVAWASATNVSFVTYGYEEAA